VKKNNKIIRRSK